MEAAVLCAVAGSLELGEGVSPVELRLQPLGGIEQEPDAGPDAVAGPGEDSPLMSRSFFKSRPTHFRIFGNPTF